MRSPARGAGPERVAMERTSTFAEGLATRYTFDLTFDILKRELDDVVTLSEAELEEGVRLALRATHNLAEGAGARLPDGGDQEPRSVAGQEGRVRHERRQHGHGQC